MMDMATRSNNWREHYLWDLRNVPIDDRVTPVVPKLDDIVNKNDKDSFPDLIDLIYTVNEANILEQERQG
jgi:hypothetical protein